MGENSHNKYNRALISRIQQKSQKAIRKDKQHRRKWERQGVYVAYLEQVMRGRGIVSTEFKNSNKINYKTVCFLQPPCTAILNKTSGKVVLPARDDHSHYVSPICVPLAWDMMGSSQKKKRKWPKHIGPIYNKEIFYHFCPLDWQKLKYS